MARALNDIRLSLIAAVADNGVIGNGNSLPWRLSSDLKRFKSLTMGKPIVMGRKTYETIGKPLAGRVNIVVSRQSDFAPEGMIVAPTLGAALALARERAGDNREIMVIGGGEIYRAAINQAERLYITHVKAAPEGDTFFPTIDSAHWREANIEHFPVGEKDSAATKFVVYERITEQSTG